jgi:hypothetical protein
MNVLSGDSLAPELIESIRFSPMYIPAQIGLCNQWTVEESCNDDYRMVVQETRYKTGSVDMTIHKRRKSSISPYMPLVDGRFVREVDVVIGWKEDRRGTRILVHFKEYRASNPVIVEYYDIEQFRNGPKAFYLFVTLNPHLSSSLMENPKTLAFISLLKLRGDQCGWLNQRQ